MCVKEGKVDKMRHLTTSGTAGSGSKQEVWRDNNCLPITPRWCTNFLHRANCVWGQRSYHCDRWNRVYSSEIFFLPIVFLYFLVSFSHSPASWKFFFRQSHFNHTQLPLPHYQLITLFMNCSCLGNGNAISLGKPLAKCSSESGKHVFWAIGKNS